MTQELSTQIKNGVGVLTLDAPRSLNSLTLSMVEGLWDILNQWQTNPQVSCVFLQGSGEKAFCAGGDVRRLYNAIIDDRNNGSNLATEACTDFFTKEYKVDHLIHRFKKPIIVWGDGVVMGGGIGLFAGASDRIVTEKSKLAMPEVIIGLFPDVGGSWFLNKMPDGWGYYLALTGARLNGADAIYLGLANHYVFSTAKEDILTSLQKIAWSANTAQNRELVKNTLAGFSTSSPTSDLHKFGSTVKKWENATSATEYRDLVTKAAENEEWFARGLKTMNAGSPSSVKVIFEQLRRTANYTLEEVFQSELNLAVQCCRHPDFAEGVRALLVDKDQNPKWNPSTLDETSTDWIEGYFKDLWNKGNHPLKDL
ncbi:enoyl-CoA hydratase/isomerase family protein [Bdellovibrio sp. HCB288]|uniref:enoyl-CoA hydratase/isomerase family protein n=1 Tax=Bdellovibrio sp. HCB288 TaxID=3394355 RepID=UPI0039B5C867